VISIYVVDAIIIINSKNPFRILCSEGTSRFVGRSSSTYRYFVGVADNYVYTIYNSSKLRLYAMLINCLEPENYHVCGLSSYLYIAYHTILMNFAGSIIRLMRGRRGNSCDAAMKDIVAAYMRIYLARGSISSQVVPKRGLIINVLPYTVKFKIPSVSNHRK